MSVQAIAWVLEHADTSSVGDRLVLLSLANHADRRGRGAFPRVADIAREARLSERQVSRALGRLENEGFIAEDDWPEDRLGRPSNRRPRVWQLLGMTSSLPKESSGVTSTTVRGDIHDTPGVTSTPPSKEEPSLEPSLEPSHRSKRDAMFRSFVTACGLDPETMTPREKRKAALALNDIVASGFVAVDDGYAEFVIRVRNYKLRWPNITVTPMGMSSQWSVCAGSPGAVDAETIEYHVAQEPDEDELAAFAAAAQANSWTRAKVTE